MTNKHRVAEDSKTIDHVAEGGKKVELLPCPFCGGEAKIVENDIGGFIVYCTNCPCNYGRYRFSTKRLITKAWNRRVGESVG